jgi:predicted dehydrogenase
MLKVAIVGCGKIADAHASQIQRIRGCEIVGVCDREPLMARQLFERFPIKQHFSDTASSSARPIRCRAHHHAASGPFRHRSPVPRARANVYVEKPLTSARRRRDSFSRSPTRRV